MREALGIVSRQVRLRVGVIGLGRLWEARHKPSLARLRDQFQVTAVTDQVLRRAEVEAAQLGCAAVEGLTALIKRPDVDVVYVLTPQWFSLHPVEIACACKKPVYCALPLASVPEELEMLAKQVEESGIPFMPEFARRFYPATLRLRELLATTLGPPRLILGQSRLFGFDRYGQPGPTTQMAPAPLMIDPGSYLLDWCSFLFQSDPVAVQGNAGIVLPDAGDGNAGPDFESFVAEFPGEGWRRSPSAATTASPGARRPASCPSRVSRSTPSTARPGWNCPSASSGPTLEARTRSGSPWSRPSATCSMTSSIASSGETSRWRRRSGRPWPSLEG